MADIYQNNLNKYLKDGARSAKFEIWIAPPKGITLPISINSSVESISNGTDSELTSALTYFCYAGAFPGVTSEVYEFKYLGKTIPIPTISNPNQSWSATFYNDENHGIRKMFKDWIDAVYPHSYGKKQPGRVTRGGNIVIYQYNYELKKRTTGCMLYGAFPVTMSDVEVSFENLNQVETFQVEFRFGYFDYFDVSNGLSADEVKSLVKNAANDMVNSAVSGVKNIGAGLMSGLGWDLDNWLSSQLDSFVGDDDKNKDTNKNKK